MPLNGLSSVKTLKSSLARGPMGGADWGVRGSIYKKKVLQDPPPHPRPKSGYLDTGGYRGQNPKHHQGIIFGPKMMNLQGVRRQKPYVGVCYANDPQKGGVYNTCACT